ncbi:helix-turn-helix domain-containing protein [Ferroplasma sp.]|uniref:helix-turn-helix domain-containing protein n=1 Tax=Ferroplasma sp. TaxID=2591003 RepID=UPI00307ED18C
MHVLYSFKYGDCFASELINNLNIRIKIIDQTIEDNYIDEILSIYAESPDIIKKTIEYFNTYEHAEYIDIIEKSDNVIIVKLRAKGCPLVEIMKRKLLIPSNKINLERIDYSGNMFWEFDVNNYNKIRHIDEALKEIYDITDSNIRMSNGRHINVKSEYILKEAFERGYFDVPKKIGLKELSSDVNIPPTTLDLLLRRQLRAIIQKTIK